MESSGLILCLETINIDNFGPRIGSKLSISPRLTRCFSNSRFSLASLIQKVYKCEFNLSENIYQHQCYGRHVAGDCGCRDESETDFTFQVTGRQATGQVALMHELLSQRNAQGTFREQRGILPRHGDQESLPEGGNHKDGS